MTTTAAATYFTCAHSVLNLIFRLQIQTQQTCRKTTIGCGVTNINGPSVTSEGTSGTSFTTSSSLSRGRGSSP